MNTPAGNLLKQKLDFYYPNIHFFGCISHIEKVIEFHNIITWNFQQKIVY